MYKYAIKRQLINFLINSLACPGLPLCCHDNWFSRVVLSLLFLFLPLLIIFLFNHTFLSTVLSFPMLSPFKKRRKWQRTVREGQRESWWGLWKQERCGTAESDREVCMDLPLVRSSSRKEERKLDDRGIKSKWEGERNKWRKTWKHYHIRGKAPWSLWIASHIS